MTSRTAHTGLHDRRYSGSTDGTWRSTAPARAREGAAALAQREARRVETKFARGHVPFVGELVEGPRALRRTPHGPVFQLKVRMRLDRDNRLRRVGKPAGEEVDAAWFEWHTLRHACASIFFADGRNAVELRRRLGRHSPSFTLDTYVHVLEDDLGTPLAPANSSAGVAQQSDVVDSLVQTEFNT